MTSPITMTDAIRQAILYQLNNIHTALPGSIIDYDYSTQKASVQCLLNKVWADGTTHALPIINNVPVIFQSSGGASLTFPVNPGDTCLILFIERSTDLWKTIGGQVNPDDPRKFSLSDAVAIPGLFPFTHASQAINNLDVLLTYKNSCITIKQSGDIIINTVGKMAIGNSTTEVLDIISQLLVDLQATSLVMGAAFNGSLNPAFIAKMLVLQTAIDNLRTTI